MFLFRYTLFVFLIPPFFLLAGIQEDLLLLKRYVETSYAPLEFKQERYGFNLDQLFDSCTLSSNRLEQRQQVRNLFAQFVDHHVKVRFYSTEFSSLPFYIEEVQGRFYLVNTPDGMASGAEILSWDGRPFAQVFTEFMEEFYLAGLFDASFRKKALYGFTRRSGDLGVRCPQGSVDVWVQTPQGERETYAWNWNYTKEYCPQFRRDGGDASEESFDALDEDVTELTFRSGSRRGVLPYLVEPVWETENSNPYFSYIGHTEQGVSIGFLRIGRFMMDPEAIRSIREIMETHVKESDVLILDVQRNPGGTLFSMFHLLSMCTDRPLVNITQVAKLSESLVAPKARDLYWIENQATKQDLIQFYDRLSGGYHISPLLHEQYVKYCRFMIANWSLGVSMAPPFPLYGMDTIMPDPAIQFTGPILVLTDGLGYSCTDLFAAIVQDNQRGWIFGETTGGAGGSLLEIPLGPNSLGISSVNLTKSLVCRINGDWIENQGVTPDYEVHFTPRDFAQDFIDYRNALMDVATRLVH